MPIEPIDGVSAATTFTAPALEPPADDSGEFAASLTGAIDELQQLKSTSNELAVAAVTGDLSDIHAASIASARAAVTLELVAAVRNKGVGAFNEIMRMQA